MTRAAAKRILAGTRLFREIDGAVALREVALTQAVRAHERTLPPPAYLHVYLRSSGTSQPYGKRPVLLGSSLDQGVKGTACGDIHRPARALAPAPVVAPDMRTAVRPHLEHAAVDDP
jgi:hypothetical protein